MFPQENFVKLDASRSLLRPFLGGGFVGVCSNPFWPSKDFIHHLAIHFKCPTTCNCSTSFVSMAVHKSCCLSMEDRRVNVERARRRYAAAKKGRA